MEIEDVFGNSAQVKLINFLIRTKGTLMNLSDIARRTGLANSTVGRIVENLINIGIINEIKIGNLMRVISLVEDHPITKILINLDKEIVSIK